MANVANITDNLLSDSGVDITTKADKGGANTFTAAQTITDTTESTSLTTGALKVSGGVAITKNLNVGGTLDVNGNLQIDGNFTVGGTSTTVNAQNLAVSDNMIYMNNGSQTTITNVVANGTTIVYTADNNYVAGMSVTITGITSTPVNAFNLTNATIASATATTFTVNNTTTGTYTSGGTARAKSNIHPDLGIAAGYNDGAYKHTGIFRDATDARWKFFDGYTPEPDASVFIDTADSSFALATVQAATFIGNLTGNVTGNVSGNAGTVTNGVYTTSSYADPAWITSLAWSKITTVPANLTSLSNLTYASASFVKMTAAGTFTLDTTTYAALTGAAFTGAISSTSTITATTRLLVGTDASISVANNTQSAIRSYWGLQLLGNTQSSVDVAPTNFGTNSDFSVIIPNQQATKIGLVVRGATSQSGSLQEWQSVTPAVLAKVDASGNITAASFVKTSGTSSQFLKADGTVDSSTYYLASNPSGYTSNVGTVTSVGALTLGTTGTDLSSTVANGTTSAVITLNVPTASATNRGALSSADWSTFNGKQAGSTNLTSLSALSFVSTSFVKMTAAGTFALDTNTYYLASNPSGYTNNTGTVTSVAALTIGTTGTDITSTVANGTTAAVITLNIPTASATNRGALSSADWSTFNGKQGAITLTTTGTSGAATLVGNTLNIPQYTGGSGIIWSEVLSATATAAVNNAYIANFATLVTITLPTTAALGSIVEVAGKGAGGWKIAQGGASVKIYYGNKSTTTGTAGYISSVDIRDCVRLVCITANTEWEVISSIGNITYF